MYKFIFRLITRQRVQSCSSFLLLLSSSRSRSLSCSLLPVPLSHSPFNHGEGRFVPLLHPRRRRRGCLPRAGGDGKVHPRIPHQILQGHRRAPGYHHRHWYVSMTLSSFTRSISPRKYCTFFFLPASSIARLH
jgi:hypothetical protein